MNRQRIDQKFKKFGKLFVLGTFGKDARGKRLMACWCECGKVCIVRADNLTQTATTNNKNTVSCGCVRTAVGKVRMKKVVTSLWADPVRAEKTRKSMSVAAKKRWASAGGE